MIPSNHPSFTALPKHPFYLRCEKSSMFRCNCRIPVNSFGRGNTHVGQTAILMLNPQRNKCIMMVKTLQRERVPTVLCASHPPVLFRHIKHYALYRPTGT